MDDWVKKKLLEWHLKKWVPIFEEEEVDQNCFKCLDEETVRKLIPKIGPQVLFWKRWQAEFGNWDPLDISSQTGFSESSDNQIFVSPTQSIIQATSPSLSETLASTSRQEVVESETEQSSLSSSESGWGKQELNFPIDNVDLAIEICDPISDLIKTLKSSLMGIALLKYYRLHHDLTECYRHALVDVILNVELRTNPHMMLDTDRLIQLATLVVKIFPTENLNTYFAPYHYDHIAKRKVNARGKLYDRYHHFRGILLQAGVVQNSRGKKRRCVDNSEETSTPYS